MRRKVVQQGHNTMMVSLPSKWVKEQGIKKGDEVEITSKQNSVIISTTTSVPQKSYKEIDISGSGEVMGKRIIGALYKAGYDEMKITFSDPSYFKFIQYVVDRTCLGHEIVEHSSTYCVVKEVAKNVDQEFENLFRQTFSILLSNTADSIGALKRKEYEELPNIALRDHSVNKFSDFCRRVVHRQPYGALKKNTTLYHLLEVLEKIGDMNRDLCTYIFDNNVIVPENFITLYQSIHDFLEAARSLFFTFSVSSLRQFYERKQKIMTKLVAVRKTKGIDLHALSYLDYMQSSIFDLNGPLLIYHL